MGVSGTHEGLHGKPLRDTLHVIQRGKALAVVFEPGDPATPKAYPPGLHFYMSLLYWGSLLATKVVSVNGFQSSCSLSLT